MGLGRQERRGVLALTVVTLIITGCGFTMRYCVPHAKPMSEQVVVFKTDTVTDTVYRQRRHARHGKDTENSKKRKKKDGRKSDRGRKTPAAAPVRDYLRDTIRISASAPACETED